MFPGREKFPETNSFHDLKNISHDFHLAGASDLEVQNLAKKHERIIITKNSKHYLDFVAQGFGVITVEETMPFEEIDKKLMAILRNKNFDKGKLYKIKHSPRRS